MQNFRRIFQSPTSSTSASAPSSPPPSPSKGKGKGKGESKDKRQVTAVIAPPPPSNTTPEIQPKSSSSSASVMAAPSISGVQPGPGNFYPITGIAASQDGVQGPYKKAGLRKNIDEWSSDPDNSMQVDLYVKALHKFMLIDPNKRESFFQVAGIHGQPNIPWDEDIAQADADKKGYCTHNNLLFPVWHRPYLLLYEQRLYEIMINDIIPNFPQESQQNYREAADSWRLPFWDWGKTNKVPKLAKYPTTTILSDDSKSRERVCNPMYQYIVPTNEIMHTYKVESMKDPWNKDGKALWFNECIGTSRCPDEEDIIQGSESWRHGVVNNYEVENGLKAYREIKGDGMGGQAERMYRLLTTPMDYPTFATADKGQKKQGVSQDLNLEGLHNDIHGYVGGLYNGHMSQIPVACFDPLFWLHHCNIDRIFAMWQALNPTTWWDEGTVNEFFQHTIGLEGKDNRITPQTTLRPFHKDKEGTYWTPETVRWTYDLGYTYEDLIPWESKYNTGGRFNEEKYQKDLVTFINDTYGHVRELLKKASEEIGGVSQVEGGMQILEYCFAIRYKKYAYDGEPYFIRLYLAQDENNKNPDSDLIASVYNFSQPAVDKDGKIVCTNCKQNQEGNTKSSTFLPITPILLTLIHAKKNLNSLSKDDVLKYLQDRTYWKIFKSGEELPSYEVKKADLEIVGITNDTVQYDDASKKPALKNFKEEPTLKGDGSGALSPALKQPVTQPPPPTHDVPSGNLSVGGSLEFKSPLGKDNVVLIASDKLDLTAGTGGGIDNSQVYFTTEKNGGDYLLLLSIRRKENQIVFNHKFGGSWGREQRISLPSRFKETGKATIVVHDQGDGYEVMIDWVHATWYEKADKTKIAKAIAYSVNKGSKPVFSQSLNVKVYPSMRKLFQNPSQ